MKSILALTAATFFWGLNFHLARVMLKSVDFIEAGFWRYLFGLVFLALIVDRRNVSFQGIKAHWKGISLVGLIGLFGFNLFFFWGMWYTSAVNAALIMSLNPALTLLLSNRILKTPLPARGGVGILVAMTGVLYLVSKGSIESLVAIQFGKGDLLIFIANILFALHHVWVKKYANGIPLSQFTFLTNILCMACFLLMLLFSSSHEVVEYPHSFWMSVIGIGIFGTGMAYFLWNKGVQEVGADRAGIFMNVVPLTTAFLALFFNEPLYSYHFVCGILIIAGVIVSLTSRQKVKREEMVKKRIVGLPFGKKG